MVTVARAVSVSPAEGEGDPPPSAWPSAADRALVWLLRLAGQSGGSSWPARLYAVLLYTVITGINGVSIAYFAWIGMLALRNGKGLLEAAFASYFFGCVQLLGLCPLVATAVCGRRRYAALLSDVQQLMEEVAQQLPAQPVRSRLRRKAVVVLAAAVSVLVIASIWVSFAMRPLVNVACQQSALHCLFGIFTCTITVATALSSFLIQLKFLYMTLVLGGGFRAVDAELRSLAADGELKDLARLEQLRRLQDRLSGAFSRLVTDMTPELISVTISGSTALVITFLLMYQMLTGNTETLDASSVVYTLLLATTQIAVPCEAGQYILDLATGTRGALLQLRWEATRIGQEVSMLQEAVRRDLEHLGDLGYFRLQRSTMVAIMSTVITYFVIFLQFRMGEK